MSEATADNEKDLPVKEAKSASTPGGLTHERAGFGKNVWTIFTREFASYLNTPVAYIVICVTLMLAGVYFFMYQGGVWQLDRASMNRLLTIVPWALCLFTIPLFTMRSLSEEKRLGTIELLITMPVKDSEVILGKYFASLAVVGVQILLLAAYPLLMFSGMKMGDFDWGPFWSGILGLFLMSAAGVAIGLMFSSFTDSQILAFFLSMATLVALYAIGSAVESVKGTFGDVLAFFSFQSRFEPFARGVVDTRAVVYFVSIAVFCSLVAFRNLESRKWS
jgi:ABC-2 type transport system permease protein